MANSSEKDHRHEKGNGNRKANEDTELLEKD